MNGNPAQHLLQEVNAKHADARREDADKKSL